MVDLRNKDLIKIMWLPDQKEFLFQMRNETPLPIEASLYSLVAQYIDIAKWQEKYRKKYDDWLNKDDDSIYDINNEINMTIIFGLKRINKVMKNEMIFYWFDVDRTFNDHFLWEYCPISNKKLMSLGKEFPKINSLISPDFPLVFPLD